MTPIHVLYVDDSPDLLDLTKVYLERDGDFRITTLTSAVAALECLKMHAFDAIISDYEMPGMDGIAFLKIIRAEHGNIPFILFTGRGREEMVVEALNGGADSYIQKGGNPKAQFLELRQKIKINVERRQAQKALFDSEKKYRQLFEHAQEAVYIIQDEMFPYYNPKFIEIIDHCGFSQEEFLSQPFFTFIHPDDQKMVHERFRRRIDHDEKFPIYSFRFVSRSGEIFWWEVDAIKTEWNGRPATLNFSRDVTEQYRLKEKITEDEVRYKEMVESLPKTVLEMNEHLVLTFINNAGTKAFGYRSGDLNDTITALDLVIPEEREKIRDPYARLRNGELLPGHETIALKKDGTTFPVMVYLSPIKKKKTVTGFRAVCVDISEYKKAKNDLSEANKKLTLLCRIAVHDLKNKLTALTGYLELAHLESTDSKVVEYVQKSQTAADLIREQIEFIKTYYTIGLHTPEWQNLEEVISQSYQPFSGERIHVDICIRDLEIFADLLLREVFCNLFDNSLRHGKHVNAITISCAEKEDGLVMVYEDNGVGIPLCDKPDLFACGFGRHTGLGLFLIREILSITGITITETGEPGKGARFEICIPHGKYRFITEYREKPALKESSGP
jgi:PAS domain S-box-containing protein